MKKYKVALLTLCSAVSWLNGMEAEFNQVSKDLELQEEADEMQDSLDEIEEAILKSLVTHLKDCTHLRAHDIKHVSLTQNQNGYYLEFETRRLLFTHVKDKPAYSMSNKLVNLDPKGDEQDQLACAIYDFTKVIGSPDFLDEKSETSRKVKLIYDICACRDNNQKYKLKDQDGQIFASLPQSIQNLLIDDIQDASLLWCTIL